MRKVLYVILDGLGDDPHPDLDGLTPLAAARTPHLDSLASKGRTGLVVTVGSDIAPESDIAVFAILGYDPHIHHAGRGPLEALGSGVDMRDGDVAWRANFATVDDSMTIVDRRAGRDLSTAEAQALADSLNGAVSIPGGRSVFVATSEHRAVLHLRADRRMSGAVCNTDPAYERRGTLGVALETFDPRPQRAEPLDPADEGARLAAELTNAWTDAALPVLGDHEVNRARTARGRPEANFVLVRDAGDHVPRVETLKQRFGMAWACFAEMPVEIGISRVTGMDPVEVSASGTDPEAYARLAERTVQTLDGYDGLYVHIKGPDLPAHDGDALGKRDCIAAVDEGYFGTLLPDIGPGVVVAVTADHSTSCVRKAHTADPVPLLVYARGVSSDGVQVFSEVEAADGALGRMRGIDVLPMLVEIARS